MRVDFLRPSHPRWAGLLGRVPHEFYHLPCYAQMEGRRIEAAPEAFLAEEGDCVFFLPYLVRSCDSLVAAGDLPDPAFDVISPYGYPGPLLSDAGREPEFVRRAWEALREGLRGKGICSGFFRLSPLLNADLWDLLPPDLVSEPSETVAIDLRPEENAIWKGMREGHQETITRCRKAGFTARVAPLADHLDEFLTAYQQTMDRVKAQRAYYFTRDYFEELAGMPQGVFLCLVEQGGKVAAACIFLECQGITEAHLGGTKTPFLSKSPFHLLLYRAALEARNRGSRFLHLGGGVGGAKDNLLHFKAGFSPLRFRFASVRLIADDGMYHRLVELRARSANVTPESLLASSFFPAYRASS